MIMNVVYFTIANQTTAILIYRLYKSQIAWKILFTLNTFNVKRDRSTTT